MNLPAIILSAILMITSIKQNQDSYLLNSSIMKTENIWRIVNDGVMGGISGSSLVLTDAEHGRFSGHVSLANNGGFASVQLNKTIKLAGERKFIVLRVKGDGKRYEFRLNSEPSQYESYVHQFDTSGEWETIKLAISEFYPTFRGSKLNIPNFNFEQIRVRKNFSRRHS